MRILFILSFSLMLFAPQSFAQKDDYSAINAKNCGLDVHYEVPGSSNVDTMREGYEKVWERAVRKQYDYGQHHGTKESKRWANMTEDEFVKVCRYERDERRKKKAKKG